MGFFSFFSRKRRKLLDKGLSKTKESVFSKIARAVAGKSKVDDEVLDNLEEVLITSDVGVETTLNIIKRIEKRAAEDKYVNTQELNHILRDEIAALLTENNSDDIADFDVAIDKKPYVIMVVGSEWGRQDHNNWQIGLSVQKSRQICLFGSCRHIPCCRSRTAYDMGRTSRCACH